MNILVTGAGGQLGNEMQLVAKESKDSFIFTDVCEYRKENRRKYSGIPEMAR